MRDRLAQLQAAAAQHAEEEAAASGNPFAHGEGGEGGGYDNHVRISIDEESPSAAAPAGTRTSVVSMGAMPTPEETFMDDFFNEVKEIRGMIDSITTRLKELKEKQSEIISAPQVDEAVKELLDQLMFEIKTDANRVRAKLKLIDKGLSQEEDSKKMSADYRIRKTQYNTMFRRLCDVLSEYNETQTQFRERCKATIKRQLQYTGKDPSDEQLEEMIETGNTQTFTQGVLMDTQQARQFLRDVTSRHEDIKKLEQSIKELFDMFQDMAVLVESQGEMIDRIEYSVAQTADYVEEGVKDTAVALQMKQSTRKMKCICCTVIWVIVAVIVIAITLSVVLTVCGNGGCNPPPSTGDGGDPIPPDTETTINRIQSLRTMISARTTTTVAF